MAHITKEEKKTLKHKLREFRKAGLESYAAYLTKEQENSEGKDIKKAYNKYITKQLKDTNKTLVKLEAKLAKNKTD